MSTRLFPARRVLWMPSSKAWQPPAADARFCCNEMAAALEHACEQHADPFACPDTVLVYNDVFDEYGLPIRDGGASYLTISHCPFCGAGLPTSRRDHWFDAVDAVDIPPEADDLPARFLSAEWRRDGQE